MIQTGLFILGGHMALSQARARIMASASQLFSQYGYQAVGVDTLVAWSVGMEP